MDAPPPRKVSLEAPIAATLGVLLILVGLGFVIDASNAVKERQGRSRSLPMGMAIGSFLPFGGPGVALVAFAFIKGRRAK